MDQDSGVPPSGGDEDGSAGRFSCVVDEHPRFHLDALRWFASLTGVAGVDPTHLVVHAVGTAPSEVLDFLRGAGVEVRPVEPFDRRSPHCNKIAGAVRLAEDGVSGPVVLCDTDTVFLEDPRGTPLPRSAVAGKLVDAPVPPLEIVRTVFGAAEVDLPPVVPLPWRQGHSTVAGNFNGGLYLVPGPLLPSLSEGWSAWARWLLDRRPLLRQYAVYVDQVAMALCLADTGIEPVALAPRWNAPIHDPSNLPKDGEAPAMIHYHQEVDRWARICPPAVPSVDRAVATVNGAVETVLDTLRPDDTYRRWLESTGRRLDSPPTPRSAIGDLSALIDVLGPASILDVGPAPAPVLSAWNRVTTTTDGTMEGWDGERADVTVCLTGLTRLADAARYRDTVHRLWQASERALIVTGYEKPPDLDDRDGHFHEALSLTLADAAPDAEVYRVRVEGPVSTFVLLRPPADPHPRDFGSPTLHELVGRHPDLLGLAVLRVHARATTTFYPDHAPRLWEYPTVAALLIDALGPGSVLADVGAGVTPLAPFLTSRGYVVDTVDPSPVHRAWPPAPEWNEWDYLDYGAAGLAHRSWNCSLEGLPDGIRFDGIYSVSVIEHIPAADRRRLLAEMAARLRPGGLAVVTIDLVRGGNDLWNRNLGIDVEDPSMHGTFDDVVLEAHRVGFDLVRLETVREWGDVDVDIGLLVFRRRSTPWAARARRWRTRVGRPRS